MSWKWTPVLLILLTGCSWSKSEIRWGIASTIASGADAYTTVRMLDNPRNYECNPIMGKHPSDLTVISYMITSQALVLTIAHFMPKYRKWVLGGKTAVNLGCAINNTRLDWSKTEGGTE